MKSYMEKTDKDSVVERVESFVSLGRPVCDICRNLDPDERPEEGSFWPTEPIHYIRGGERTAFDFWGTTVCDHHDSDDHIPSDATHRVIDDPIYVGDDPDRGNSDTLHNVIIAEEVEG